MVIQRDNHALELFGLGAGDDPKVPLIIECTDADFVAKLPDMLQKCNGVQTLRQHEITATSGESLQLRQPVHRVFHLALFEARCDALGKPRLDPQRIDSAGLVVRRLASDGSGSEVPQAWVSDDAGNRGWSTLGSPRAQARDPDPERRRQPFSSGQPALDRRLAARLLPPLPLAEQMSPLFVAPPDVCAAAGKTILFGLIPVTSSEYVQLRFANGAASSPAADYDLQQIQALLLPNHLAPGKVATLTMVDGHLDLATAEQSEAGIECKRLAGLLDDFGAFDDTAESNQLLEELNTITLHAQTGDPIQAGEFIAETAMALRAAHEQVASGDETEKRPPATPAPTVAPTVAAMPPFHDIRVSTFTAPTTAYTAGLMAAPAQAGDGEPDAVAAYEGDLVWHMMTAQIQSVLQALAALLAARTATFKTGERRFEDAGRRYQARGFIRVKHAEECPPDLVWSPASRPYTIAQWYEPAPDGVPPVRITLPDITDPNQLRQLKPNVSFQVPAPLANLLQNNDLGDLLNEDAESGGLALDWICSFSIPIITICAFIVLNIFLNLLNFIFWWLPYIKICIPIPKRE